MSIWSTHPEGPPKIVFKPSDLGQVYFGDNNMKYTPEVKFPLESVVYLKHRDTRNPGIVNGILFQSSGIEYRVAWPHLDGTAKWHQSIELSSEYEPNYT